MINKTKYDSYFYAFQQINKSLEDGYFLEAITICESIITDRLLSYGEYVTVDKIGNKATLGKALQKIQKNKKVVINDETDNLLLEVDNWRLKRNLCVHSVAKSSPGMATIKVADFLIEAEQCARSGKALARKVCNWHKQNKKAI
jgi:hypothetical protein